MISGVCRVSLIVILGRALITLLIISPGHPSAGGQLAFWGGWPEIVAVRALEPHWFKAPIRRSGQVCWTLDSGRDLSSGLREFGCQVPSLVVAPKFLVKTQRE